MSGILAGKTAVVFGVANKRSIAWAIAQGLHAAGAQLAVTYQNERLEQETAASAMLVGHIQKSVNRLDSDAPPRVSEPAADGATRLLIRTDGESEVVHVLGRKTTVGRTPDNDLQIDAKFISRHHAVILAGPAHAIIEDLNSTNGVSVNNKRITRQPLKDGRNDQWSSERRTWTRSGTYRNTTPNDVRQ